MKEYCDEKESLRFAQVAYEGYLTSDSNQHGIPTLVAQRCFVCDEGFEKLGLELQSSENEWCFE